jgi:glyoxylase-like metal-dependent hydrolase (beta-lactamase superfamily II)
MITLASGLSYFDLDFLGLPRIIATAVLHGPGGVALVDPGPSSTLPALRAGLGAAGMSVADLRALLLTHIHLDHAGASGTLVREVPGLRVYVHERGAPHLVNPEKLLASAARLYGDDMDRLWGSVLPVPHENVVALQGGERISAGGRDFEIAYTPGHASHHVSYFNRDTGIAFVGDTAGVRLNAEGYVVPPTPPPDIDIESWRDSLGKISAWLPETLFITHFGPHAPPAGHLAELAEHLDWTSAVVRRLLAREGSDEDREAWFADEIRRELRRRTSEADVRAYEVAGRFDLSWRGLARYWRKRLER